jgi:lipopolysaccharide assembly outer membrane protein LptD (OstA)
MAKNDIPEAYEGLEDVSADQVTINQGGAARVEANTVEVTQGGIQAVEAHSVTISQGGAFVVDAENAVLTMSGAGMLTGDNISLQNAGAGIVIADTFKAEDDSMVGFLLAGSIEGNPNVKVDARSAAAFGAGLAITLFLLRRIFGRR